MSKIWMMISRDKYALPMAVADTASELARITGEKADIISSIASKYKHGKVKNPKFIQLDVDDDE